MNEKESIKSKINDQDKLIINGISRKSLVILYDDEIQDFIKAHRGPTFKELLKRILESLNISNNEFYKATEIDKKLLSAIFCKKNYNPSKHTIFKICIGLKLTFNDSKYLLESAGYSFKRSDDFDLFMMCFLQNKYYYKKDIDELLRDNNLPTLFNENYIK